MNEHFDKMVIVAHPDDAEIGAAGTVAGWTEEGLSVVFVICTNGDRGTGDRTMTRERLAKIRQQEQLAAAEVLGVGKVVFLDMPDQHLEETPAFREEIVRQVRRHTPDTVITMDPYRRYLWHRDHRIVGQVVMDALFPLARDHMAYPEMLDEGLEPHKVREVLYFGAEDINHHVDITATFDRKVAALRCHASQIPGFGTSDPEGWLRQRAAQVAEGTPYALAEAFHRVVMPG